jgi:excisionase family DNA binding protein
MNLLRIKKVAELLDTTERTIWNKIRAGELPVVRVAGITRVDGDKLDRLLGQPAPYSMANLGDDTVGISLEGVA